VFSYEVLENGSAIILTQSGRSTIEDYQDVAPKFFADVKSQNIRRILLDLRQFEGWGTEDAPTITFFSWIESLPLFDRIAIVFHDGVRNEVDKFEEFFRNADKEVRRFRPDRYEAALDWLKAGNGESPA
jgi:hypothetical protein